MVVAGGNLQLYGWRIHQRKFDCSCNFKIINLKLFTSNIRFLLAGLLFGIIIIKGEVVSWLRIQEMFRLQSFHMYGIIGSAIITGMISIQLIKKFKIKTVDNEVIKIIPKTFHKG